MKARKLLRALALTALLAVPAACSVYRAPQIHASTKRVALPYAYRGVWGANRSYGPVGTKSWKNPIVAKFYRRSGYRWDYNAGTGAQSGNGAQIFTQAPDTKGWYSSLPSDNHWSMARRGQAGILFRLSRNHRTMYYDGDTSRAYLHRISNRRFNSLRAAINRARSHKRRWRRIRRYRTGYRDHYGRWHAYRRVARKRYRKAYRKIRSRKARGKQVRKHVDNRKKPADDSVNTVPQTNDDVQPAAPQHVQHVNMDEIADREIHDINQDREAHGVSSLISSGPLNAIARKRARQANQVYSHYDPNHDGAPYDSEDARQMGLSHSQHGIEDWGNGENLNEAYPGGSADQIADEMNDDFMYHDADSGWGHRRNILDPSYRYVGVGTDYSRNADDGVPYKLAEDFSTSRYF